MKTKNADAFEIFDNLLLDRNLKVYTLTPYYYLTQYYMAGETSEVVLSPQDEELLRSRNMRAVLEISPEGLATLDKATDGAASEFRASVEKAVTRGDKKPE